ncbi:kinase-like protein [Lindgomyces ingoldianus]|uniref:Kinase-like protein n=1 Tax=Lindgomyces ingoldianus TaxID=673940 RepID=A0ACB6QJD2_9PLEO|nr:kinase-like protein [Lindgomyces ingoldianus]KAF2466251.1 kinase-like protein [Lindgomyces ingoldianus]
MGLAKRWRKGKLRISAPEKLVQTGHGTHDEITLKLQGLPPEWVSILRENGVVGEDLVLPKKSKSGIYANGFFNLSKSSLLSNRSFQSFLKGISGKPKNPSLYDNGSILEEEFVETPGVMASSSVRDDESPLSVGSPGANHSASHSRQSGQCQACETGNNVDGIAQECGLTFRHKDYQDINHSLLQVVDSLGHGSLGVVEEVRIGPEYTSFVRKRVQIPYNRRRQYLKIISQEAQVLQNLSHCHIVKMIGSYSEIPDSGRQFFSLLMAPVGQRDLKTFLDIVGDQSTSQSVDWIEDRRMWLLNWFKCLSSALAYIHSKGVRHQDIKPSNIIHRRSAIYFTDFSSASQFQIGQTTSTENPARTSAMYAAPEVINNDDSLNRHGRGTDVFALGAVFTEMLAVLRGKSIEEYHQFLASVEPKSSSGNSHVISHAPRQTFLYGRKLDRVDAFFSGDEFYSTCVAAMLTSDREQRPDAKDVASRIRRFEPKGLRPCSCDEPP